MKSELDQMHEDMLSALDELEALTAEPIPNVDKLSAVRWKLSKASGRRLRHLEQHVYPQIRVADEGLAKRLQQLREEGAELRAKSTGHVGTWAIAEVLKDWPGYCQASAEMRRTMRERIERERDIVAGLTQALGLKRGEALVNLNGSSAPSALPSYASGV